MDRAWPLFVALLSAGCGDSPRLHSEAQNLLLITLDTTRADRLGPYGYARGSTPVLDAFAEDGIVFDEVIAPASITPTTHATLLTGLWPHEHGVRVIFAGSGYRLSEQIPSLPQQWQRRGAATGAFLSSFTVSDFFGFDVGFDHFDSGLQEPSEDLIYWKAMRDGGERAVWDHEAHQRRSDDTVDEAIEWLGARGGGPFFAWVHLWDPHDVGLLPPEEFLERFPARKGEGPHVGSYDAEIAFMDQQIGRLFEFLRGQGLYENTVIVVVADHGEGLGDHDWGRHRLVYQEQIHVPLLLRIPEGPRGVRVRTRVRTVDLLPTLNEIFDQKWPVELSGSSLGALALGAEEPDRIAYAEALNGLDRNAQILTVRPADRLLYAWIEWPYKLIHDDELPERSQLYDLAADPEELTNIYALQPEIATRLRESLIEFGSIRREPFRGETDAEAEERLRALGYLGGR